MDNIKFDNLKMSDEVINIIKNSAANFLDQASNWLTNLLNSVLSAVSSIATVGIYTVVTILATYFICADRIYILDQIEHHLPKEWVKKLSKNINKITKLLGGYLKAEATLIIINFILVLIGLFAFEIFGLNVGYPLLMALLIAFSDALPILRIRYSNATMGSYVWYARKYKISNSTYCAIYNHNGCKATIRTKSCK